MKTITLLLSALIFSSCNVMQLIGGKTEIPDDFYDGYLRIGSICSAASNPASSPFHQGDGTSTNPYVICNASQLSNVSGSMSAYYILDADLSAYNQTHSPIGACADEWCNTGTGIVPFTGAFDGKNYIIYGLNIQAQDINGVGLFGNADNAYIQNIEVRNANISVSSTGSAKITRIGGIIGNYTGGSAYVGNLRFDGKINVSTGGFAEKIGGVFGNIDSSVYANVLSVGPNTNINITIPGSYGVFNVGTIAGFMNSNSNITEAYSEGHINIDSSGPISTLSSVQSIGGIVGRLDFGATVDNSIYKGGIYINPITPVSSYVIAEIGGLVGLNYYGYVERSYAAPQISITTGSYDFVGGAVGKMSYAYAYNSYGIFDPTYLSGGANVGGFTGTYIGGSFGNVVSTGTNCAGVFSTAGCIANVAPTTLYNTGYTLYTSGTYPWDFTNIWAQTSGYPMLKFMGY